MGVGKALGAPQIVEPCLLLVEGRDEESFLRCFLQPPDVAVTTAQIVPCEGVSGLRPALCALAADTAFAEVRALGVIRDADDSAARALQSVADALEDVLGVQERVTHGRFVTRGWLRVGAFIMPDGESPGSLETLCLRPKAVQAQPGAECVRRFIECLAAEGVHEPEHPKRLFQAFLAAQREPGLLMGYAAEAGYFDFEDPCWAPLRQFVRELASHA